MQTDTLILLAVGAFGTALPLLYALSALRSAPEAEQVEAPPISVAPSEGSSPLASLARPQGPEQLDALRRLLAQAGLRNERDMDAFLLSRALLALALPVVAALTLGSAGPVRLAIAVLISAAIGYYIPWVWMQNRRQHRQENLSNSLPDALDMLVSCVEAGLGLDAALTRVAREIRATSPDLADELDLANAETAAGLSRGEALHRMDQRTGVPEINALVNVLAYAEKYGAGIADSIRAHAQLVRRRRALAAEERAARATPKLTVIMIIFILPVLFVVVLGPAVINIVQLMIPSLRGVAP